jgi:hypothetical protein
MNKIKKDPQFGDLINLLENYPNIIKNILGDTVELTVEQQRIFKLVKKLPKNKFTILTDYFRLKRVKPSDSGVGTASDSGIGTASESGIETAEGGIKEDIDKDVEEEELGKRIYNIYIQCHQIMEE